MRILLLVVWLLIPICVGAYHFGPGQNQMKFDLASRHLRDADTAVAEKDWAVAQEKFEKALATLPTDAVAERRAARLELCKVQMSNKQLPTANQELESLLNEVTTDAKADPKLVREAQVTYANSQYYLTWLMRLEGQPRTVWEKEIDSAQMIYRKLAEEATSNNESMQAEQLKKDLESCVRLARMDIGELQGLPLPSQ